MNTPDILVIGGGIVGCSLARELARASRSVCVVEGRTAGSAASSAAAGLLSPALATAPAGPLLDLCYQSAELYPAWVEELRQDGAGDGGFDRAGLLDIWADVEQRQQQLRHLADRARPGRRVEELSAAELYRREPALAPGAVGGPGIPTTPWSMPPG